MEIKIINLEMVNCYLLRSHAGFILVDAGPASKRPDLERELEQAGCQPGNLNIIIVTHGDSDHVGNCAYLRGKYGAKIALHCAEAESVERGDSALNRKIPRNFMGMFVRFILQLFKLDEADRFKPDLLIDEDYNLAGYGLNARVLHIPGHSNGSLGILTPDGELLCGDLLNNYRSPAPGFGIFDRAEFEATLEKLKRLTITIVYPGHGKPFAWEQFVKRQYRS